MENGLRLSIFLGLAVYMAGILYLLKRGKLTVKYSIVWLISGVGMLFFIIFPSLAIWFSDVLHIKDPVNFVFAAGFAFVLLIALSLSASVSALYNKQKTLIQTQSLLEKRLRETEAAASKATAEKRDLFPSDGDTFQSERANEHEEARR